MTEAVIFDFDGTVLDNEWVWEEVFRQVARNNSLTFNTDKWIHTPGIGVSGNWKKLIVGDDNIEKLTSQTHALYRELTATDSIKVREGLIDLIEQIKEMGLKTALATSSQWHAVENQLEELSLELAFDVTTTGDEILSPKPDPEIYLLTMQKLGIEPSECLVIEDSIAGVESAYEAGCKTVGFVTDQTTVKMLKSSGAEFTVESLLEVVVILREHASKKN